MKLPFKINFNMKINVGAVLMGFSFIPPWAQVLIAVGAFLAALALFGRVIKEAKEKEGKLPEYLSTLFWYGVAIVLCGSFLNALWHYMLR